MFARGHALLEGVPGLAKTLLISTHILQEVQALADRVLMIHAGHLVFDGSPADLLEDGSLEAQFHRLTGHATEESA